MTHGRSTHTGPLAGARRAGRGVAVGAVAIALAGALGGCVTKYRVQVTNTTADELTIDRDDGSDWKLLLDEGGSAQIRVKQGKPIMINGVELRVVGH